MSATAQESPLSVDAPSQRETWPISRWIIFVALTFAAHIGLIFAFGDRKPVMPRPVVNAPTLQVSLSRSELQSLQDPTLFALPHPRGFAAATLLETPRVEFAPFRWTEPPQLLDLQVGKLANALLLFAQTNVIPKVDAGPLTPVQTTHITSGEQVTSLKQHSTVTASGSVAKRRWLNSPILLRSWPATDLLTNSIVRVIVDTDGLVFSPALIPPGSGSKAADQYALEVTRSARFAPLPRTAQGQTVGALVFEWHTVPMPDTNTPSAKP